MAISRNVDALRIQGTGLVDCGVLLTLVSVQTVDRYQYAVGVFGAQVNSYRAKDPPPALTAAGIPITNLDFTY